MTERRIFLGWDRAVLPAAADWLITKHGYDLSRLVVAVPAARAGRRLEEILADAAADAGEVLSPPMLVTVGQLPELLYTTKAEPPDALTTTLTRAASLRSAERELLQRVIPNPPDDNDAPGWYRLAEQLGQISEELAAARLNSDKVVQIAADHGIDLGLSETRWQALAELDAAYRRALDAPDRQMARQRAIVERRCRSERPVVLIGLVDLSAQLAGMLEQLDDLTPLVPAPAAHAAGFDWLGGLVVDYWQEQSVELADLRLVDQPRDQAIELVRVLGELPPDTAADDVTVGLGDEDAAGSLVRAIELAGTPARPAAGRAVTQSAPAVLLETLGRYATGRRFADLAALVRHPDLVGVLGKKPWPNTLDQYAANYLQADTRGPWRGDEKTRRALNELTERLSKLQPEAPDTLRPLPEWSGLISQMLAAAYGQRELDRFADHDTVEALTQIGRVLGGQSHLSADLSITPPLTFSQAVTITLTRLAGQLIPEPGGTPAVELLGFLELPWDDAEHVVLTDVNEGNVPDSRNADAFLPDGLRRPLGLPDNARRYARDVLLLNIVLRTRPADAVSVLACRRSAEGDPKTPSRLLLACDEQKLVERVTDFYPEDEAQKVIPLPRLLTPGGTNRFLIPKPLIDGPPLDELSVTKFRDYLACPYRFYLKHIHGLRTIDDRAVELNGAAFGNLAHEVLAAFGRSSVAAATEAPPIRDWLTHELDRQAAKRYGQSPAAAVRVQIEQLRQRLTLFAHTQAREAASGWRIDPELIEQDFAVSIDVDGQPFRIKGKIDRIDRHPELGVRLIDYKTRDKSAARADDLKPDRVHRQRGEWVDLQLPLYRLLAADRGMPNAETGYFNLGGSPATTAMHPAGWSDEDYASAADARDHVIRQLRAQRFWPPKEPPPFDDGFARLAADHHPDRSELIGAST
ncbi:MAG: PD-(D/E)XK nuclease family protein [Planctomycetota bacterium]